MNTLQFILYISLFIIFSILFVSYVVCLINEEISIKNFFNIVKKYSFSVIFIILLLLGIIYTLALALTAI